MDYEPLCKHKNVNVEWQKQPATIDEPTPAIRQSECVLFIGGDIYIGKAYCDDCQSYISDHETAARIAFEDILSDKKTKQRNVIVRLHNGSKAFIRNKKTKGNKTREGTSTR